MSSGKKQRLEEAIVAIRREYGEGVLPTPGDLGTKSAIPHLSTGFPLLDRALEIGGLPRGHLTHISGIPTSGAMTLVWKVLAEAKDEAVACIDLLHTFDADYATRCGVDTESLLLVQPPSLDQALETLSGLVDTAAAAVLILESLEGKPRASASALNRLMTTLHCSSCVLMLVEKAGTPLFADKAAVRLHLQWERWLRRRRDVSGYRSQVRILKNQFGRSGHSVCLTIGFSTAVHGDGA
jgi:recombination protein RecA